MVDIIAGGYFFLESDMRRTEGEVIQVRSGG